MRKGKGQACSPLSEDRGLAGPSLCPLIPAPFHLQLTSHLLVLEAGWERAEHGATTETHCHL